MEDNEYISDEKMPDLAKEAFGLSVSS